MNTCYTTTKQCQLQKSLCTDWNHSDRQHYGIQTRWHATMPVWVSKLITCLIAPQPAALISLLLIEDWHDWLNATFSPFRSSWPNQQGDPNLPRAKRTSMRTIKSDAVQRMLLFNPDRYHMHSQNPFFLVYLKLNCLGYFIEMTIHW